ncbi:A24 family peptidase [Paenibacillus marinisediminis]
MLLTEGAGAALLLAALVTDIRTKTIPNLLTVSALGAGLLLHTILNGWEGLVYSSQGMLVGFVPTFILYLLRAIGGGDVKLFAALGGWMGSHYVWQTLIGSILLGGIIAGGLLLFHYRSFGRRFLQSVCLLAGSKSITAFRLILHKPSTFPFMIAVVPAAVFVYFSNYSV